MGAAQATQNILGQCLLVGQEVGRSGLDLSNCKGVYRYLRPLTIEETVVTLTGHLVELGGYTKREAEKLLAQPTVTPR